MLLAVILMGGIFSVWGAVVAGLLSELLPALLRDWATLDVTSCSSSSGSASSRCSLTAPGGLVDQVPKDLRKLGRGCAGSRAGRGREGPA